jgi:hypothetical protein
MFSNAPTSRIDFAETRSLAAETPYASGFHSRLEAADASEMLASADAADLHLLRLVGCAALATVVLALATSFAV